MHSNQQFAVDASGEIAIGYPNILRLAGSTLRESFRLRFLVWNGERRLIPSVKNAKELYDEHDDHAVHFGIIDGGLLVARLRCCIHEHIADLPESQFYARLDVPSPIATMNRLVVRREYRNRGYARALDEIRIRWAIDNGAKCIIVCGQPRRSKSLSELGFTTTDLQGKSYFYDDDARFIVHYRVVKTPSSGKGNDTFRLKEITDTDLVAETFDLRYRVWAKETQLLDHIHENGRITDEHDNHARHWAAFSDDGTEILAAARVCVHTNQEDSPDSPAFRTTTLPIPVGTMNRLVVKPSARGLGLARELDLVRISAATQAAQGAPS